MNAAQARAVRATFTHVSDLLEEVLRVARDELTPFDHQRLDLTPAETESLTALVAEIRDRMLEAMATLGVSAPAPERSARARAATAFLFSQIALSELSGKELRGYGALHPDDERRVGEVTEDLGRLLEQGQHLLRGVER